MNPNVLSITERTILANQYHILSAISQDEYESESFKKKADILEHGYEGHYHEIFDRIYDDTFSADSQSEVFDILEMFRKIRWGVNALSDAQKEQIDLEKLSFRGFDANNDKQFHFLYWWDKHNPTNYYKEDLGDISGYNSHTQSSLPSYKRMLAVHETFDFMGAPRILTFAELQALNNA